MNIQTFEQIYKTQPQDVAFCPYRVCPTKIHSELGWLPETKFADGIKKTIAWYLNNRKWWEDIINGEYQNYYQKMYENRLV